PAYFRWRTPIQGGRPLIRDIFPCVSRLVLFCALTLVVSGSATIVYAQTGQVPQVRNNDGDSQRTQYYDQLYQLQQQQQDLRNMDVTQRTNALEELPYIMWLVDAERERLKEQLRANFRRHYAVIRKNADDLIQLTSSLEADLENSGNQAL